MPQDAISAPIESPAFTPLPVRQITADDLRASLSEGFADFKEKRGDLLLIGLLYPVIGIVTSVLVSNSRIPLLFPLLVGLLLLGPLVATGFYELARRREAGLESSWHHFFDVFRSKSIGSILAVGAGLLAIFALWLGAATILYAIFFGPEAPTTITGFFAQVFGTAQGWGMILAGAVIGAIFAVVVLAVSVVSLPMLVDRKVSAERAVATSLAAFGANKAVLLRWGVMVAAILALASIPLLIGLAFALPVLGYATWHLYTRLIDRSAIADRVHP